MSLTLNPPQEATSSPRPASRRGLRWFTAPLVLLVGILAFSLLVPIISAHGPDRVYPDFVRAPPGLSAHPTEAEARQVAERTARRLRARLDQFDMSSGKAHLILSAARPLDPQLLMLFARTGIYAAPLDMTISEGGQKIAFSLPVKQRFFFFGTDGNGRDLLARIASGGRISLSIGVLAAGVALLIGVAYGAITGFFGGRVDALMMRAVDVLYAMPYMFFVILLVAFFGRSLILMFLAVGAVEWLDMARIVRGETLSLKQREFVRAAEALGVGQLAIIRRHIIPNMLGRIIAYATLLVPRVILLESFLSFLGLGVQEPATSWGVLIADGARAIDVTPYLLIFPAAFLCVTLFAFSSLGERLRRAYALEETAPGR